MFWIDIASPRLRTVHTAWIARRGAQLMPPVNEHNGFTASIRDTVPDAEAAVVVVPPGEVGAVFKHIGGEIGAMLPGCAEGRMISDIDDPYGRDVVRMLFSRVFVHRQPDSRRSAVRGYASAVNFEVLLLPFSDNGIRVRLIHALYEIERRPAPRGVA